ncbi:MAG: diacylglycerol/lipid kinase family protein, partial [Solirubrobacterales bacterium]
MGLFNRRRKKSPTKLPVNKPGEKIKMLLVVNPYATTVSGRLKNVVVYALQSRYELEVIDTRERNHATAIVRDALGRGHYDIVCSFGGDGTANEVINGMFGTDVPFTFLPGGMTNVIGRILGIPDDIVDATEHLLTMADHFEPRRVDLGDANGRKFIFGAGCGLDAEIVEKCESRPALKKRFGQNYYAWSAVLKFSRHLLGRAQLEIEVNGEKSKGIVAIAQNARPFTYFGEREIDLAPSAGLENRTLSLTVLDRANPLDFAPLATRILSQKAAVAGNRHIRIVEEFDRASVRKRRPDGPKIALQTDGDFIGHFDEVVFT